MSFDPVTGQLPLQGDTGIRSGIRPGLESAVGRPRLLFLYDSIVGFAAIRIVDLQLGGKKDANGNTHHIIMQPSVVIDDAAVAGGGQSDTVYQPVVLVRQPNG